MTTATNLPANVKAKIDETIVAEGGDKYTNDPTDRGGPTKYGITQATYNAFGFIGDVKNCTYDQAVQIYALRYWSQPGFDKVGDIHAGLAFEMFDWGVTSGPSRPSQALQRSLNVLNQQAKDYPDISADGRIGPMTLHALQAFVSRRGVEGLRYLVEMVQALRRVFYMEISERDQSQEKYANGWQSRIK